MTEPLTAHEIFKAVNFYLLSFDRNTPLIVIEDRREKGPLLPELPQELWGRRPDTYLVKLDPILYDYIERAHEARVSGSYIEMFRSSFQAIEHIAYTYGNMEVRNKIKGALSKYNALINLDATVNEVYANVLETIKRMNDKKGLIFEILSAADIASHAPILRLIDAFNQQDRYFEKEIQFDGGFRLPPLPRPGHNDFVGKLAANLVNIRNAIVHVKDHKANNTIIPNKINNRRISPYSFISMELAIYLADFYSKFSY